MKGTAYLFQATLVSFWWLGLWISQPFYDAFQFSGFGTVAFNSFLIPDLVVIAFLSVLRAYTKNNNLDLIILGGFGYAALYCVNAMILTHSGILSTAIMLLGLFYNLFLIFEKKTFRNSNTNNFALNGSKTLVQIICVWGITLGVIPVLIMKSFNDSLINLGSYYGIGVALIIMFSSFGLSSAYVMVKIGQGTPLPMDQTQKLVTKGAYNYVRNPMAIAGIGQGIGVSILFASIHVFVYALLGAVVWHLVVRPIEEKDMVLRFGKAYEVYRDKVKCWVPTFK
jgi:protein-S-isoprenylcysteine O-methyltransferase Ste14